MTVWPSKTIVDMLKEKGIENDNTSLGSIVVHGFHKSLKECDEYGKDHVLNKSPHDAIHVAKVGVPSRMSVYAHSVDCAGAVVTAHEDRDELARDINNAREMAIAAEESEKKAMKERAERIAVDSSSENDVEKSLAVICNVIALKSKTMASLERQLSELRMKQDVLLDEVCRKTGECDKDRVIERVTRDSSVPPL